MGIDKFKRPLLVTGEKIPQGGGDGSVMSVVRLTQAEYNALPVKDEATLYVIVG